MNPIDTAQSISVFDMFKIGVGPSSSHTMGPWLAALRFLQEVTPAALSSASRIQVDLFGSLAKTGIGHGTDIAIQLGLSGFHPESIDTDSISERIRQIGEARELSLLGNRTIPFSPKDDIVFHFDQQLDQHPNGLRFCLSAPGQILHCETYFSIGGGFVVKENESLTTSATTLPFPIDNAKDLLGHCASERLPISGIVMRNELTWRTADEITEQLARIRDTMLETVHRGCQAEGTLPGGLCVVRRASKTAKRLLGGVVPEDRAVWLEQLQHQKHDFSRILDWVSCFALATNEENAAFGRVVTAPTNGAAGVIPAVMMYLMCFCKADDDAWLNFLLTASEIGCIFKKGATISAAQGGCQAEIGVSAAMAAAGLAECLGGSAVQAAEAAEIAMEHHLGMTCDPIRGLVQIPCIERNAMGAIKAITAAQLAVQRSPAEARVSLDAVVNTMWQTALDMNSKYKETSEGGLATQIAVNLSEC